MINLEISVTLTDNITMEKAMEMRKDLLEAFEQGKLVGDVKDAKVVVWNDNHPPKD